LPQGCSTGPLFPHLSTAGLCVDLVRVYTFGQRRPSHGVSPGASANVSFASFARGFAQNRFVKAAAYSVAAAVPILHPVAAFTRGIGDAVRDTRDEFGTDLSAKAAASLAIRAPIDAAKQPGSQVQTVVQHLPKPVAKRLGFIAGAGGAAAGAVGFPGDACDSDNVRDFISYQMSGGANGQYRLQLQALGRLCGISVPVGAREAAGWTTPAPAPDPVTPVETVVDQVQMFMDQHDVTRKEAIIAGAGLAVAVVAAGTAGVIAHRVHTTTKRGRSQRQPKKTKRGSSTKRPTGRKLKFGSAAWRRKYGRKKKSTSRSGRATESGSGITGSVKQYRQPGGGKVRYAKNGTPYVIGKDGRPRFIKGKRKAK